MSLPWPRAPGLYAMGAWRAAGILGVPSFVPYYIGRTECFATRMPDHEKWARAVRLGARTIMACVVEGSEARRDEMESDLIAAYNPPLNEQKRTGPDFVSAPRQVAPLSGIGAAARLSAYGFGAPRPAGLLSAALAGAAPKRP